MEQRPSPVFLRSTPSPVLPPPVFAGGPVKWVRENMLAGPGSALFTVAGLLFIIWVTPGLVRYRVCWQPHAKKAAAPIIFSVFLALLTMHSFRARRIPGSDWER